MAGGSALTLGAGPAASASAVARSAGRNASSFSSAIVTSAAVANTATVVIRRSSPRLAVSSSIGTAKPSTFVSPGAGSGT